MQHSLKRCRISFGHLDSGVLAINPNPEIRKRLSSITVQQATYLMSKVKVGIVCAHNAGMKLIIDTQPDWQSHTKCLCEVSSVVDNEIVCECLCAYRVVWERLRQVWYSSHSHDGPNE